MKLNKNNSVFIIIVIVSIVLLIMLFLNKNSFTLATSTNNSNWNLIIMKDDKSLLNENDNSNVYVNYNVVMVDMYKVLSKFGKAYGISTSNNYSEVLNKISQLKFAEKPSSKITDRYNYGYRTGKYTDSINKVSIDNNKKIIIPDVYYYVYNQNNKQATALTDGST